MVSRGARNLVFLSRSGAKRKPAEQLVKELESRGCRILAEVCDVSSEDSIRRSLDNCKTLPPIKGCIQAAMQLKVSSHYIATHIRTS
jgi:NAD(P)-dependent dehydrogenase (short-subunit alcohol dehydrogenase family)